MRNVIIVLAVVVIAVIAVSLTTLLPHRQLTTPAIIPELNSASSTSLEKPESARKPEPQSAVSVGPLQKIDDHFSKDTSHVYYETFTQDMTGLQTSTMEKIAGADPVTFTRLAGPFDPYALNNKGGTHTLTYYADASHVYLLTYTSNMSGDYVGVEILPVDRDTFAVLGATFAKDKNAVYETLDDQQANYILTRVPAADVTTFTVLPRFINGAFAKDANHAFYGAQILQNADPKTFVDVDMYFVKDAGHVYTRDGHEVEGAYPASLVAIGQGYAEDAQVIYYFDSPVEGVDRATFTLVPLGTANVGWGIDAKDKNHKYWGGEIYTQ